MKKLIPVATLLVSFGAHAQCNKKIDPSKVMLFIDTNNSELEIATTEKAACERGQKLVVVPKNYKEYIQLTTASSLATKKMEKCIKAQQQCADTEKQLNDLNRKIGEMNANNKSIRQQTEEALKEIKASNGKLQNVSISGHDGGGHFGGFKGGFGRHEFSELMRQYGDINEVSSLLLLGCYTGVPKEVIEWKHIFPGVKIIAGYDGSAPLSDKPHGHQYISDVLLKEKKLLENAEQKKLQSYAKQNVQGLIHMNAAMYLDCNDGTKGAEFYFGSQKEGKAFRPFDIKECEAKMPEIEALNAKVEQFYSGEMEPPKDTATGALRGLYNEARRIEHCGEIMERPININALFNMLFNEGVKKNFANFYKDDLAEAEKIFASITIEDIEKKSAEQAAASQLAIDKLKADLAKYEADPELLIKDEKAKLDVIIAGRDKLLNDPAYAEAKRMLDPETGAYSGPMNPSPELTTKLTALMTAITNTRFSKLGFQALQEAPERGLMSLRANIVMQEKMMEAQKNAVTTLKESFKSGNKPWVPTAQNLASKTRKEMLKNLHDITSVMMVPGLTNQQRAALGWITSSTSTHLQYFQNPFSWHEYTGTTEAPQFTYRLKDMLKMAEQAASYGGYSGYPGTGYVSGNNGYSMGTGMAGGMMGGGYTTPVPNDVDAADDEDNAYSDESEE